MKPLRSLPTGTPRPNSVASADAQVERTWQALCAAERAWAAYELGNTEDLFRRRDVWVRAIDAYEAARVALRTAVARRDGRRWLRAVST